MVDISRGAANAVHVCMGVTAKDKVVILGDRDREHIARALAAECELAGAPAKLLFMEDFAPRPYVGYPDAIRRMYEEVRPTVNFLPVTKQPGELQAFRQPLMNHIFDVIKPRHAHMIAIDDQLMTEGMTADYEEVARLTFKVNEIVKEARLIEVQTPSGTDMRAQLDPSRRRWHPCPGIYRAPGEWGNLPEGETFTSPMVLDGIIGAEVCGDWLSEKYGVLAEPARIEVGGSWIRRVETPNDELRADLEKYLTEEVNGKRAAEFAVGTNVALKGLSGNLTQDEKLPGVHVAFGDPYPAETGADWTCRTHIDFVATRSTIKVDGQYLMRDGEFVF